jgi:hypothetical protein
MSCKRKQRQGAYEQGELQVPMKLPPCNKKQLAVQRAPKRPLRPWGVENPNSPPFLFLAHQTSKHGRPDHLRIMRIDQKPQAVRSLQNYFLLLEALPSNALADSQAIVPLQSRFDIPSTSHSTRGSTLPFARHPRSLQQPTAT